MKQYDEIMSKIVVTEEMKMRILKNIGEKYASLSTLLPYSFRSRYAFWFTMSHAVGFSLCT